MSEETKRLLKCDLHFMLKEIRWAGVIVIGLWLWIYFLLNVAGNMMLMVSFVAAIWLLSMNVRDWRFQIRMYVNASMRRKAIFQVLLIRNAVFFLIIMLIESVLFLAFYSGVYAGVGIRFWFISVFSLLLVWGLGEIAGVLVYQRKKLGQILMIIDYLLAMIPCMFGFISKDVEDFWIVLLDGIPVTAVAAGGVVSVAVLAGGIWFAGKHMDAYMVY